MISPHLHNHTGHQNATTPLYFGQVWQILWGCHVEKLPSNRPYRKIVLLLDRLALWTGSTNVTTPLFFGMAVWKNCQKLRDRSVVKIGNIFNHLNLAPNLAVFSPNSRTETKTKVIFGFGDLEERP